ncbi:MAG: NAD-dependent epimerase/dehydratase family protein [Candidatus Kapaibacterium sp.]
MKILVTGGAGFIGSHIADAYIRAGHEVVIIDNLSGGFEENIHEDAVFIKMDINNDKLFDIFSREKFDIVSHHAAQMNVRVSVENPKFDAKTNILGGLNIFEACRKFSVKKIIFASSGGTVYGEQVNFPASENDPTEPDSPYGISKLANEKYLAYYRKAFGLESCVFRYGNVYGPRQNPHGEAGVVAIFTEKMIRGGRPVINGDGSITRDYVYIDDVIEANLLALNKNISGIFNIGTGKESSTNDVFKLLKEITASDCEEIHGPAKKGEQLRSLLAFDKFSNEASWQPKVSFYEGLKKTVEYFRNRDISAT